MSTQQPEFSELCSEDTVLDNQSTASFAGTEVVDLRPLEDLMRKVLVLIEEHPEWHRQARPVRMKNILRALRTL